MRGKVIWCPDHDAPTDASGDCWQCVLEWEATDQAAAAAAARAALPARRPRPAAGPAVPATASADQARLDHIRARLDQRDDQVPGQLTLEVDP